MIGYDGVTAMTAAAADDDDDDDDDDKWPIIERVKRDDLV